jgi:hypothetical protein
VGEGGGIVIGGVAQGSPRLSFSISCSISGSPLPMSRRRTV